MPGESSVYLRLGSQDLRLHCLKFGGWARHGAASRRRKAAQAETRRLFRKQATVDSPREGLQDLVAGRYCQYRQNKKVWLARSS